MAQVLQTIYSVNCQQTLFISYITECFKNMITVCLTSRVKSDTIRINNAKCSVECRPWNYYIKIKFLCLTIKLCLFHTEYKLI